MLPITDIDKFCNGSVADQAEIASAIASGCEQTGFLYVRNHGIPDSIIGNALDAAKAFLPNMKTRKVR